MNDYADRNFDRHVERTRTRPLATGEIPAREALALAAVLASAAFLLVLFLNWLAILLSFVALAITIRIRLPSASSPCRRRTSASRSVSASRWRMRRSSSASRRIGWGCSGPNLFHAFAYDTEYAMVDRDDDARLGLAPRRSPSAVSTWRR